MELYVYGKGHRATCVSVIVYFILTAVDSAPRRYRYSVSDECDWFGSGLEKSENNGIQPVYLRCREGVVEWQYPRGALRVILQMGQLGKEFQVCLKVDSFSSGATLFREQRKRLKYLFGDSEQNVIAKDPTCFKSVDGHVALFLEAKDNQNILRKNVFRLMYDLEPLKEQGYSECRPCSERELLYLFCAGDFVARGFISSFYQNEQLQQTELTVHSYEVYRDSEPKVFNHKIISERNNTYYMGTITRPLHCGTKVGIGEFLFVGRWKLGIPKLSCAPRFAEWEKMKQKAIKSESLDCMLP